ncbi:MAG: aminotransferase class V-fold PLP-dependent enzyme [Deltaproteobacteria bacterium]|nr:aminotransferase class V-fold PLP-dependent enzyme [Deltaproteobacteria bacterium]
MISVARKILLNPGPATTTDTVKAALVVPDICPREQEFVEVMRQVRQDLVQIAGGDVDFHTCVLLAGSGTAAMDAVLNSVIPPNRGVAVINNGAYGARLAEIARCYQLPLVEINFAWGAWPDLELIDQTIQSNPEISHLALVHHETSTGMLNPLPEIAALAQDRGLSLIVDAISSLGGVPVDVRQQHIDYLLCTSNKCLQGMAGLSWVICRREALEQSGELPGRSYYLNLYQQTASGAIARIGRPWLPASISSDLKHCSPRRSSPLCLLPSWSRMIPITILADCMTPFINVDLLFIQGS